MRQRRRLSTAGALLIRNTSTRRQAATSQVSRANVFTSKSSLEFGEDVKKRLRLLSEVVLRTVKRRLTSSFAIFFGKKNGGEKGIRTPGTVLPVRRFSKPLLSATQPSLRIENQYILIYTFLTLCQSENHNLSTFFSLFC